MAALALLLSVAACGREPVRAEPAAPPPAAPGKHGPARDLPSNPLADPAGPVRVVYGGDLISDPLPAPPPKLLVPDAATALALAARNPALGVPRQHGRPQVALRLVSLGWLGSPSDRPQPRWVLLWRNSEPILLGPQRASEATKRKLSRSRCVFLIVIDAQFGAALTAEQHCV